MGLFSAQFEKEGTGRPLPTGGGARYFALLISQFWKLLGANLLFVLFSLPVFTVPAALCALNRVCLSVYRRGSAYVWQDFFEEFRSSLLRHIPVALMYTLLLFAAYYLMSLGLSNGAVPVWSVAFWTLGILAAAAALGWSSCYFVLAALLEQKNSVLMKNSVLLCLAAPLPTAGRCALIVAFAAAVAALFPVSLFLMLLFLPGILQYTLCFLVYEQAQEYMD